MSQQAATAAGSRKSLKSKMRTAVLTERIDVAGPEAAIFKFQPKGHELFNFAAGQYATLGLDVGDDFVARAYSIASSPHERDHLELYINEITDGHLTPSLFNLRHRDEVSYMGPKGVFTLTKTDAPHLLFIATGTGLAPYISMLRTLWIDQERGTPHGRTITLVHGVRFAGDLAYRWELDGMTRHEEFGFLYLPMVSRPEQDRHWTAEVGRGRTTVLLSEPSDEALPEGVHVKQVLERFPAGSTAVYLCGNPDMVTDSKALLEAQGYDEILTEEYW